VREGKYIVKKMVTKKSIAERTILYQVIGYGFLLFLIVGDEVFDFPHTVFGFQATPINWVESIIEGSYIIFLGSFTIFLSLRYLKKIKFLEGLLPICAHCKKIRKDAEWESLEKYMDEHSEARFSHGLCPECYEKYYGGPGQDDKIRSYPGVRKG
jgi:hypothetical protein